MLTNNIYIIGAGAIGKALAVLLKLQGKNVTIIREAWMISQGMRK